MLAKLLELFTGRLLDRVLAVWERYQDRKVKREVLEAELKEVVAQELAEYGASVAQAQKEIILAEAQGESWLQRNWRPIVAITFAFVILFYGLILPIAVGWFRMPPVRVGDALLDWIMTSLNIAVGGYIGGRTIEKVARTIAER